MLTAGKARLLVQRVCSTPSAQLRKWKTARGTLVRQSGFWTLPGRGKINVHKECRDKFLAVLSGMKKAVTTGDSAGQSTVMKQLGPDGPGPCRNTGTQKVLQRT